MSAYKLIIFDIDGTLSTSAQGELRPDIKPYFKLLKSVYPDGNGPTIALVAQPDGASWRDWMETHRLGEPEQGLTQEQVDTHIFGVAKNIEELYEKPAVYTALAYRNNPREGAPIPAEPSSAPYPRTDAHKPEPDMLVAAMAAAGVTPEETLLVSANGAEAAQVTGCNFMKAGDFFQRDAVPQPNPGRKTSASGRHRLAYFIGIPVALIACGFVAFVFQPTDNPTVDQAVVEVVSTTAAIEAAPTSLPTVEDAFVPPPPTEDSAAAFLPTQESPIEQPKTLTPLEEAYANKVTMIWSDMKDAFTKLGELVLSPQKGQGDWAIDVAVQLATIKASHEEVLQMNVPHGMESFHRYFTEATGDCNTMADHFTAAIENQNGAEIELGISFLKQCSVKINQFETELNKGLEELKQLK